MSKKTITHRGKTLTISQWSKKLHIPANTIRSRLNAGKPVREVLSQNVRVNQYE